MNQILVIKIKPCTAGKPIFTKRRMIAKLAGITKTMVIVESEQQLMGVITMMNIREIRGVPMKRNKSRVAESLHTRHLKNLDLDLNAGTKASADVTKRNPLEAVHLKLHP